jgi:hypothetical protein
VVDLEGLAPAGELRISHSRVAVAPFPSHIRYLYIVIWVELPKLARVSQPKANQNGGHR